ncbi:MAG: hypothetical protein EOP35_04100 [Rubrivivax sp.]|nr:MAG: hypothetical protein EOP35_04100 [Rubrivivax sp.]
MTKVSITPKPTFTVTVDIPQPGAEALKLPVIYRHRTKSQLAEFSKVDPDKPRNDLAVVMDVLDGWEADKDFSRDAVEAFLNDHHAAGDVIVARYINELTKARAGN